MVRLDSDALREILDFIYNYIDGLFVCGTYGSGPMMSVEERKRTVEEIINNIPGRLEIIVHVGATSTQFAVDLARHAQDIGATRIASVPPYYYRYRDEYIIEYFTNLVNAVDLPVYLYNNPNTVGYAISPQLLSKLEKIGVKGVKDSSFDVLSFINYRRTCSGDFDVVAGTEALMLPLYVLGARAFIAGMSNYLPELIKELFNCLKEGKWGDAEKLQYKIVEIREIVHSAGASIVGVHTILNLRGIKSGYPKSPFKMPSSEKIEEIRSKLIELNVNIP
ncbi:MAG: dihydrodipicolinate synthase family protein [Candidatus Methanomethylicia archaeon]